MTQYPIDPFTPAVELAGAIRRKEVSPVEVVDGYLERIDELDPRLNAFCHRADDDVRKAAAAAADAVVHADVDRRPPAVPRRPAADQGPRRRGRLAHDPRVRRRQPGAGRRIGPGRAAVRGRGVRAAREDHHLRVRHRALHRERGPGHLPQPMGPRPHAGRLVEWLGRRGRRRDGADRARRRRRRLDPHPGVVQRPRRAQAHPRPGHQRDRRLGGPRHQRRPHPHGGRHRRRPRRARPPRPGGVVVATDAAGVLRRSVDDGPADGVARRRARRRADRRDGGRPRVHRRGRRHPAGPRVGRPPRRRHPPSACRRPTS